MAELLDIEKTNEVLRKEVAEGIYQTWLNMVELLEKSFDDGNGNIMVTPMDLFAKPSVMGIAAREMGEGSGISVEIIFGFIVCYMTMLERSARSRDGK